MTRRITTAVVCVLSALTATAAAAEPAVLKGKDAFGSWQGDAPGTIRLIRPADLPKPGATASAANVSRVVQRPASAVPKVVDGFKIALFAEGLSGPRIIRTAPNGDIFVAETRAGRVRVLRPSEDGSTVAASEIFADRLGHPFGIAFYPSSDPQWVYVASTERVMRFPYRAGDMKASGAMQVVVPDLPAGYGHSTRDVVFTTDGQRMLVSVGSAGNVGEAMGEPTGGLTAWIKAHPLGAAWGGESDRAGVLAFDPDGKNRSLFATGIRNCVGLAIQPATGAPWCSTNERDGLGDDLVPDYVTRVKEGGFYGWPWYYIGDNEDPRHRGERADLKGRITVPDVLLQPHSASLGLTFYDASLFPPEYRGDAFAAEHGSWNRSKRTGYKVIRIRLKDGVPTGEYEDFVTGFVINDREVWGRPVGVAVARDGSLLISEDGNGTIWRVTH
ncbi:putative L-sorbosone dehydrogenase [Bradyrhizobium sp. ORS 375]|uniref:PQQ-dependent sugar dehydrogenase n=1 Tax=Bradyrhizobium sp. (strain ORS 375) TaxID=566679 RepID=UPI000240A15A|nr:sorbosone dehydrogenase family protein [Bradyrhizobium sp. ORS 375]CCD92239.1 putative L-sorbosone dehydrogenase [Bradyrhizobium sp. ORS 375]